MALTVCLTTRVGVTIENNKNMFHNTNFEVSEQNDPNDIFYNNIKVSPIPCGSIIECEIQSVSKMNRFQVGDHVLDKFTEWPEKYLQTSSVNSTHIYLPYYLPQRPIFLLVGFAL